MAGVGQLTGTPGYGGGGRAPAAAQHGRYYTHQSQVPPGQKVGFTPGRGFYAAGAAPAAKAPVNPIVALVNQILAMQQKPLTQAETLRQQQADQQQQQLSNTTHGIIGALQAGIPAASQAYDSAIQQTSDLAKTASGLFQAANPDAQNQATLKAIGAPAAQQQQVAGLDQSLFNGGPNYVLGGQIPGGLLAGQKAAQVGFLAGLPASYAAQGQIGQANLRNASDAAHAAYLDSVQKILATAPQLVQQYQSAAAADRYKQAQLDLERQTLGLKTAAVTNTDPITGKPLPVKPSASLSKVYKYVVDANGNPVLDANGNRIPVLPPPKTGLTQAEKDARAAKKTHATAVKNKGNAVASYKKQVLSVPTTASKTVYVTPSGKTSATPTPLGQPQKVKTRREYNAIMQQVMGLPEVQILTDRFNLSPAEVRALAVKTLGSKGIRPPARTTTTPRKRKAANDLTYGDPKDSTANYGSLTGKKR